MLLVLEVGNTNTKIGVYDGDRLRVSLRLTSRRACRCRPTPAGAPGRHLATASRLKLRLRPDRPSP